MSALSKIADEIRKLADHCEQPDYQIDPFDLRVLARKLDAQAEIIELEARP